MRGVNTYYRNSSDNNNQDTQKLEHDEEAVETCAGFRADGVCNAHYHEN